MLKPNDEKDHIRNIGQLGGPSVMGEICKLWLFGCPLIEGTFLRPLVAVPGRYTAGNPPKIHFKKGHLSRENFFVVLSVTSAECVKERERERERPSYNTS